MNRIFPIWQPCIGRLCLGLFTHWIGFGYVKRAPGWYALYLGFIEIVLLSPGSAGKEKE